jgi:hypothetical protein
MVMEAINDAGTRNLRGDVQSSKSLADQHDVAIVRRNAATAHLSCFAPTEMIMRRLSASR